jgi:hypothetical protein
VTIPAERLYPKEVTISPEHPKAELNLQLPPKAGFLHIHLTNEDEWRCDSIADDRGNATRGPKQTPVWESCDSKRPILLPPDMDLLVHVTSPGFIEWAESAGMGRLIRLSSGEHLELDVHLSPSR